MNRQVMLYIGAGALIAAGIAAYFVFAFVPMNQRLSEKRQALAAEQRKLAKAKMILDHWDEYQERADRLQRERRRLDSYLPAGPRTADLLQDIARAAAECNIRDFQFVPQKREKQDGYWEERVHVRVSCGYHTLGLFISKLAALPRLVNTQDVQITGKDRTGRNDSITADMVLKIYERLH